MMQRNVSVGAENKRLWDLVAFVLMTKNAGAKKWRVEY